MQTTLTSFEVWATTPVRHPSLTVIIPAYNEQDRIIPTIGAIAAYICGAYGTDWDLVVADDGSTDATVQRLSRLGLANLLVLSAPSNRGKGDAIRRGFTAARGTTVLFADADQSTPIEHLGTLMGHLNNGADIVIASRAAQGGSNEHRTRIRTVVSALSRMILRFGLGLPFRDTQCGFKLYTRDAAKHVAKVQHESGFAFDLEHLFAARRVGMRIDEVGVAWTDAPGSKVDTKREIARFLTSVARIRRNAIAGVYDRG